MHGVRNLFKRIVFNFILLFIIFKLFSMDMELFLITYLISIIFSLLISVKEEIDYEITIYNKLEKFLENNDKNSEEI